MIRPIAILTLIFGGIISACSEGRFKSSAVLSSKSATVADTSTSAGSTAEAERIEGEEGQVAESTLDSTVTTTSVPLVNDEDQTALSECLKQWGKTPFTAAEIAQPKIINISESISNNGLIFSDDKATTKPALFLVNFNINVGNNGELAYLNPNGWYCFNVKAKVINNFIIHAACDTHVAIISKQAQNDKNFMIQRQEPCPAAG